MDLSHLNEPQRQAVLTTEGPLLILAGAGSGKTRVLTHRIAYIIGEGKASPYEILALTFTNKAAREMRERVEALLGESADNMWVTTFHSACVRILRVDGHHLGYERGFVIYDDQDQISLIQECQKALSLLDSDYPKRQMKNYISDAKNNSLKPEDYLSSIADYRADKIYELYKLYQRRLKECNAMDFDDLLLNVLRLFTDFPDVLAKYRRRFRYILVDEYQDTNHVQYSMLRALASQTGNLCVVGDDDQSIYGWRGASVRNILDFEKDFPGAAVFRLEQNYRSTGTILDAANALISNNIARKEKTLWTDAGEGEKLAYYQAGDDRDEAAFVCDTIMRSVRNGDKHGDFAVLYRTNAQSRVLEGTLASYGMPYKVYGGMKFYDRREIKDVLAYLRVVENPADDVSLRRIINVPRRGIGDAAITELEQKAREQEIPLMIAALEGDLPTKLKNKLEAFANMISDLIAYKDTLPLGEFAEKLLEETGYLKHLQNDKSAKTEREIVERVENVRELLVALHEYGDGGEENTLSGFLESVALVSDVDSLEEGGSITLMTLHSAKGLEFPSVFLVGMEEGVFPHARSAFGTPDQLEEERRLAYVGITRAKRKLYLTSARTRLSYTGSGLNYMHNAPSRFIKELPEELFERYEHAASSGFGTGFGSGSGGGFGSGVGFGASKSAGFGGNKGVGAGVNTYSVASGVAIRENGEKRAFERYQRVNHAKFGNGTIVDLEGAGSGLVLTVDFETSGTKKIVASLAPITHVEG